MYYSLEPPSNFHNFAEIQNNNIDQIDGLLLSTVIGQYGVCRIQQCQNNLQEIEQWLLSLGYYYDSVVPQAILGQHDNYLSYFPDNEEILVFYNNSSRPIKIHIENSTQILPTLKFAVKNWFDYEYDGALPYFDTDAITGRTGFHDRLGTITFLG